MPLVHCLVELMDYWSVGWHLEGKVALWGGRFVVEEVNEVGFVSGSLPPHAKIIFARRLLP